MEQYRNRIHLVLTDHQSRFTQSLTVSSHFDDGGHESLTHIENCNVRNAAHSLPDLDDHHDALLEPNREGYHFEFATQPFTTVIAFRVQATKRRGRPISVREQQVLQCLVDDLEDEAIAASLFVSKSCVRKHISRLRSKFRVNGRAGLTARAIALGFVEPRFPF